MITYTNLLKIITDLMFVWSSSSPTVIEKNILENDNIADMIDIQKTLSTMLFTYIEKNVSHPNPRQRINTNTESHTILIEGSIELKIPCILPIIVFCF
ncbi:TPA: hypothetical protein DCZ39_07590 [Patescibacteria group bacterium]|nr:hypothetical protein [Candidatus Gracilibacteria bacterium]